MTTTRLAVQQERLRKFSRSATSRALLLSSTIAWASGCPRIDHDHKSREHPSAAAPASSTTSPLSQRDRGASRYTSEAHGFTVEFPFEAQPQVEDLGGWQTSLGNGVATSYHVSRGDTAFDVQVTQYPDGSLAKDTLGLLKIERDGAIQYGRARVVAERTRIFAGPGGTSLPGLELELDMPGNGKAFRVTCFLGNRSYVLSAAGPASDPALNVAAFRHFADSFHFTL